MDFDLCDVVMTLAMSTCRGSTCGTQGSTQSELIGVIMTRTPRDRDEDPRERDPRDPFIDGLDLPRGAEREFVLDGHRRYELNGDDSRTLATIGAFRVVAERDLSDPRDESLNSREPDLRHLRDEGWRAR
jgi:hypothetical protein